MSHYSTFSYPISTVSLVSLHFRPTDLISDPFQLQEDKIRALQEKLELCEQKLAQYAKLPEMEEELRARMQALSQVRDQVGDTRLGPALRTPLHKLTAKGAMNCRYIEIRYSAEN